MLELLNDSLCFFYFVTAKSPDYDKLYKGLEVLARSEEHTSELSHSGESRMPSSA